ncbi:MAG TPA: TolC family protein [Longimicrobiales bacterium]|nr:TolC family protein [Longimicrobiales bacterium]
MRLSPTLALTLLLVPTLAAGQGAPAALSLSEAVDLARANNPDYLSRLNDEVVANWGVRSAYGSFLPGASVSGGLSYQGGGEALIGGFTGGDLGLSRTPSYYYSSFSAGVSLGLSGADLYRVGREKAGRQAVVAEIAAAERTLEALVTRQYLAALRGRDAVALTEKELERAEANLALAEARYAVQSATAIETKQAEVERGRAQVELVRARAGYATEKLRLLQQIGVNPGHDIELTTSVEVFEPSWRLESLLAIALGSHPQLAATRAGVTSAEAGVGMARSAYYPSLSLSAGLSGYTRRAGSDQYLIERAEDGLNSARMQCLQQNELLSRLNPPMPPQPCAELVLTDADRADIIAQNRQFPFDFETQPFSMSLGISVPVFQGLSRQHQVEAAAAQADDARLLLRGEELRIRTDVEAAYLSLQAAYQAHGLETGNHALAEDQLRLARERYRVGSASFLELMEAETVMARADRAYLLSVYAFQEALTALEAAVGQDLANPQT